MIFSDNISLETKEKIEGFFARKLKRKFSDFLSWLNGVRGEIDCRPSRSLTMSKIGVFRKVSKNFELEIWSDERKFNLFGFELNDLQPTGFSEIFYLQSRKIIARISPHRKW